MTKTSSGAQWAGERHRPGGRTEQINSSGTNILSQLQKSSALTGVVGGIGNPQPGNEFDIMLLREKSKHLDLPLISALCNDRSLLKQTKILGPSVMPSSANTETNAAATVETAAVNGLQTAAVTTSVVSKTIVGGGGGGCKTRKTSISHRHPNDKLPPLPVQMAEANNYVMDPAALKHHKGFNGGSNDNNNSSNNNNNN